MRLGVFSVVQDDDGGSCVVFLRFLEEQMVG